MTVAKMNWIKMFSVCSSIAVPLLSILYWLTVNGTHLVDKVDSIGTKQVEQGVDIKELKASLSMLSIRVDTIGQRQKEFDYRFSKKNTTQHYSQVTAVRDPATGKYTYYQAN